MAGAAQRTTEAKSDAVTSLPALLERWQVRLRVQPTQRRSQVRWEGQTGLEPLRARSVGEDPAVRAPETEGPMLAACNETQVDSLTEFDCNAGDAGASFLCTT